jgi:methyl-accepting chemotaxis protein
MQFALVNDFWLATRRGTRSSNQEIARNVQRAASGTHEVSSNMSGVSVAVLESPSVAEHVRKAAEHLSQHSAILEREVG